MRNNRNSRKPALWAGAALIAGAVWCGTIQEADATPATLGFYPATDIYGPGVLHLDVDSYRVDNFQGKGFNSTGLTLGLGDRDGVFGRNEVGFDYIFSGLGDADFSDSLLFNAKTQLYNNAENGTRLVGGAWLLGSDDNAAAGNVGYLSASKSFEFGRITAGVAHAFRDEGVGGPDADTTYLHLGYDRAFGKLLFATDFYSGKSVISGVQPSLYYSINSKLSVGVGYFMPNDNDFADDQLYLCLDANFGGPASPPASEGEPGAPGATQ